MHKEPKHWASHTKNSDNVWKPLDSGLNKRQSILIRFDIKKTSPHEKMTLRMNDRTIELNSIAVNFSSL